MKLAIPVESKTQQSSVCVSFGRTPYFLIYDTENEDRIWLDNEAAASQGGAGIKAAQAIVDSHADILITPRCGENAAAVLKAAGIKIFGTINDSISENINAAIEGKLSILKDIHAGFHHHGGK